MRVRGAVVPAALTAHISPTGGVLETDAAALGPAQSVEAAGRSAASGTRDLMEEGVTQPRPRTPMEPAATPSHSEVNGDLPGNPYLTDGTPDEVMESPEREPDVLLQYPDQYG